MSSAEAGSLQSEELICLSWSGGQAGGQDLPGLAEERRAEEAGGDHTGTVLTVPRLSMCTM